MNSFRNYHVGFETYATWYHVHAYFRKKKFYDTIAISFCSGKHTYLQILTVHLDDYTDKGTMWKTWENLSKFAYYYFLFFIKNLNTFLLQRSMKQEIWILSQELALCLFITITKF
jgi:hypothetical protein